MQEALGEARPTQAIVLLDQAYRSSRCMNNRFVADGRHRTGERAHVSLHGEGPQGAPEAVEP